MAEKRNPLSEFKRQVSCCRPKTHQIPNRDEPRAMSEPVGLLNVKIIGATNLKKKDFLGKSDPYVEMKLTGESQASMRTTVKMNNLNPEWNENFTFVVKDPGPESQVLELHVNDWDKVGTDDKLGIQSVLLKNLTAHKTVILDLDLLRSMDPKDPHNEKPRGKLTIELMYKPFKKDDIADYNGSTVDKDSGEGLLVVTVHGAEDVEGKHHTNPYAKLTFRGEKRKTKPVKKDSHPIWDQEFEFIVEKAPVKERLRVDVKTKSKVMGCSFHGKEHLGYVDIELSDIVHKKRINESYCLVDSRNGKLHIELRWRQVESGMDQS